MYPMSILSALFRIGPVTVVNVLRRLVLDITSLPKGLLNKLFRALPFH